MLFVLVLLLLVNNIAGLFFEVEKSQRCFYLELPMDTHIRAEYESPHSSAQKKVLYYVFGPRDENGNQKEAMKQGSTEKQGIISFTSSGNGEHWICLHIDGSKYDVSSLKMEFSLKISLGSDSFDYLDIAKKEHLDDLELSVMKLRDRVRLIQKQLDYAKHKDLSFRDMSERNNLLAMWVSVVQIILLVLSGVYQVRHLQNYFRKKKLI